MVLEILGFCEKICGKVLMQMRESDQVSEFLEQLKIGLYQKY
jgi:hypothetical protein